jgi:hypothetical protein
LRARVAPLLALLALAVVVASLAYLHLEPTGLSPVRNAASQYGITSFRAGYRVATIAFAAAGIALAVGLGLAIGSRARQVVILLVIFAMARAMISWFPMDAPGADRTPTGQTHGVLAVAAFGSAALAAFRLAGALPGQGTWHSLVPVSLALGCAMTACLVALAFARRLPAVRARFGAIERGFYLSAIAWFAVFAAACVTASR